jgi:hypothetical protein
MAEYILLMHDDADADEGSWDAYLSSLKEASVFQGGSEIGVGRCARKHGTPAPLTAYLTGSIRVIAHSLDEAASLLAGNPHYEAGGTVEIRELPRTD